MVSHALSLTSDSLPNLVTHKSDCWDGNAATDSANGALWQTFLLGSSCTDACVAHGLLNLRSIMTIRAPHKEISPDSRRARDCRHQLHNQLTNMAAQHVSPPGVNNKEMAKIPGYHAEDFPNSTYTKGPLNVSLCCLCRSDSSCFSSATKRLTGAQTISSRVTYNAEALVSTTSPSSGSSPSTGSKSSLVRCSSILGTSSRLTSTRIVVV